MKTIYQFFIILFILGSFYLMRDDLGSVAKKIYLKINSNKEDVASITLNKEKENFILNKTDTPGALRVAENYLNINNIKLSQNKVIEITNNYRKDNNLLTLKENQKLNLSAEKKLQDMFDKQYFEHASPSGVGVGDLGEQVGYEYIIIGENLAMGNFKDDQALVDAWMASEGHRANILNKKYTEIGVAAGKGVFDGKSIWMAVQHFGTPRNICPTVDRVLYGVIDINQSILKEMEADLIIRKEYIDKGILYQGSTYPEQVKEYNNLVNEYNNLVINTKQKVDNYNNQINKLNLCLTGNQ